ncbi:MAG: hypothetical protein ACR2OU_12340 [Thermomicrobiales bacterium]
MIDIVFDDLDSTNSRTSNCSSSRYVEEILSHAGLAWQSRSASSLARNGDEPDVLVLAGEGVLDAESREWINSHVQTGMALVTTGSIWGLDDLLGVSAQDSSAEGFIGNLDSSHPIVQGLTSSLHVFGGIALRATSGAAIAGLRDATNTRTAGDAVVVRQVGKGVTVAIGPDIPASVLHIQLGRTIHEDGLPAPDGTAAIDEGILKTDDGVVLDWDHDRESSVLDSAIADCPGKHESYPDGDTPWFAQPIADELRALLLNAIHWAAAASGHALPVLAAWPRKLSAVGLISHDSDGNLDAGARTTRDVLAKANINSTWCHIWGPNYPSQYDPSTFDLIRNAGHELALHYNSLESDGGTWGRDHLATQAAFVRNETGVTNFTSNKNHYLRWEGNVEFFHWLADEGIQADQCKGPSKKGNVGYPHGSCQPWFPLDTSTGEFIDVLEVPLQFQDLWLTTPAYMGRQTIAEAIRHHGVAHFLFHQVHIHTKLEVSQALLDTVEIGREYGLEWWTCAQINDWERQRRAIKVVANREDDGCVRIVVTTPTAISGATIAIPLPGESNAATITLQGNILTSSPTTHAGLPALLVELDLNAGETVLELHQSTPLIA